MASEIRPVPSGALITCRKIGFAWRGRLSANGVKVVVRRANLLGMTPALITAWHAANDARRAKAAAHGA